MKKLMSIASAMLCVTALAALDPSSTSLTSGVVGYGTLTTGTAKYQGVGAFFFNFDGAMSNDLTKITVDCVGGDGYMDPWTEYLRQLNPASAGNLACYTYINKAFCDAVEADYSMIGWYRWQNNYAWDEEIAAGNTELKVASGQVVINIDQAFLGQFLGGCDFHFVCKGTVVGATTEFQTGTAKYHLFHNYTPANVNLTQIEVECVGGDGYMDPWTEYIRQLNPASAGNLACYTYINAAFCDAVEADYSMIGWYKWQNNYAWDEEIAAGNKELKVADSSNEIPDVVMTPGFAFLGQFLGGCNFHFRFPNPLQ